MRSEDQALLMPANKKAAPGNRGRFLFPAA